MAKDTEQFIRKRLSREVLERNAIYPTSRDFAEFSNTTDPRDIPARTLIERFDDHVLYQDDHILALNKPAGILSYADYTNRTRFGVEEIATHILGERIYLAHRLDGSTTGVLLLGKHFDATVRLQTQFANKEASRLKKMYLAFLDGEFPDGATEQVSVGIQPVDRSRVRTVTPEHVKPDDGTKDSLTYFTPQMLFQTQDENPQVRTLTGVRIITGRRHQIRVTAAESLGKPVTGDKLYNPDRSGAKRPLLHAWGVIFEHPQTYRQTTIDAPIPRDFENLAAGMKRVKTYS